MPEKTLDHQDIQYPPQSMLANTLISVFFYKNTVYRKINKIHQAFILELISTGLIDVLASNYLMPITKISSINTHDHLLIEQEKIPTIIQPQEWSYSMLKAAAKCVVRLNKIAFDYGYQTYDCHGFNVLFHGAHPQFVDLGSFVKKYENNQWAALDEFISRYLYPLKLWSENNFYLAHRVLADNYWNRFLPKNENYLTGFQDLLHTQTNFDLLMKIIDSFIEPTNDSLWSNYHDSYLAHHQTDKPYSRFDKILSLSNQFHIESAHDVGGNAGIFTRLLASNEKIKSILCSDVDSNAIDKLYMFSENHIDSEHKISCCLLNVLAPIHNYGNKTPEQRLQCDAVFALALTHHLLLGMRADLEFVLKQFHKFTKKYIFIEFMPFSHIDGLTRVTSNEMAHYSSDWFQSHFIKHFELLHTEQLEVNRMLFIGKKITAPTIFPNKFSRLTINVSSPILLILSSESDLESFKIIEQCSWSTLKIAIYDEDENTAWFEQLSRTLHNNHSQFEIYKFPKNSDLSYEAISLFFNNHDNGIIIEHGFQPNATFLQYCQELLQHHEENEPILQISGSNLLGNYPNQDNSYFFSAHIFTGTFGTWKSRWDKFQEFLKSDVQIENNNNRLLPYYTTVAVGNWKYKWALFGIYNSYLSIQPNKNLTKITPKNNVVTFLNSLPTAEIQFPLQHPGELIPNINYDQTLSVDFFNPFLPFTQNKLPHLQISIEIECEQHFLAFHKNETVAVKIKVKNTGTQLLSSLPPFPIHLSYHWLDTTDNYYCYDGLRTGLYSEEKIDIGGLQVQKYLFLLPGESREYTLKVSTPEISGRYQLNITAVQEGHIWFDQISKANLLRIQANIE